MCFALLFAHNVEPLSSAHFVWFAFAHTGVLDKRPPLVPLCRLLLYTSYCVVTSYFLVVMRCCDLVQKCTLEWDLRRAT